VSNGTPRISDALIEGAKSGDDTALGRLVEQVYPTIRRWALVQTGDPTEADDLTQEVAVMMIRKLDTFQGDARFESWLYSMTRNAAIDSFRKRKRSRRLVEHPHATVELMPDATEDPSRAVERAELSGLLRTFFSELPNRQREVFDLVELQGMPATEAAELMGVEAVSVRAHLFKARRQIRSRILATRPELAEELP